MSRATRVALAAEQPTRLAIEEDSTKVALATEQPTTLAIEEDATTALSTSSASC